MLVVSLLGCATTLEGPEPVLAAVDPALICVDRDTPVTVTGSGLTPAPTDVLDAPTLQLPDLTLVLAMALDGTPGNGQLQAIDEAGAADEVQWVDDTTMTFVITGSRDLPEGVYDLGVANIDGQASTLTEAFAAMRGPVVEAVSPDHFNTNPGGLLTLTGAGFLQVTGGAGPNVTIGAFSAFGAVAECVPLAGPIEAQVCSTITVMVPSDAVPGGEYPVVVTNPVPADCASSGEPAVTVNG